MTWRTITGKELVPPGSLQLETLLKGVFEKGRLLDLVRNFIVFEDDGEKVIKKLAGYHQFHAVNKAVATTVEASRATGDPARPLPSSMPAARATLRPKQVSPAKPAR